MSIKSFFSNWIVRNLLLAVVFVLAFVLAANILLSVLTRHGKEIEVPDFTSMTVAEAARVASASGIEVRVSDSMYIRRFRPGAVYSQNPTAGSKVKHGRKIRLTVNTMQPVKVKMPSLIGYSLRQAKAELQRNGLVLGRLIYVRDIATNSVISQQRFGREIAPGTEIFSGSTVNLVLGLSESDQMTFVPDLTGRQYRQAIDLLQESSLNTGRIIFDSSVRDYADSLSAVVYSQVPSGGTVRRGTEVSLRLGLNRGSQSSSESR